MKDCNKVQELILENKNEIIIDHINQCENCMNFLKTSDFLFTAKKTKIECPSHLSFETFQDKSRIVYFKWTSLVTAAIILLAVYFPSSLIYKGYNPKQINYMLLSQKFNAEIDLLEQDLCEMENNLISNEMINYEIEDLTIQINELIKEGGVIS